VVHKPQVVRSSTRRLSKASPDDEDITMSDTTIPSIELQGPIMRSRV
jgi:hypothetical protein